MCALSGGCDSVCLLLLMTTLKDELELDGVFALHVHHVDDDEILIEK